AAAILNLDPTHEEACRYAMEARAVAGDIAGALRLYKALWDLLDHEYGMEPSPETLHLVARIKLGEFERAPAGTAAATARHGAAPNASAQAPAGQPRLAERSKPKIALLLSPFET